jgi:1-acyl-sn-glycerol-3-phosphate acyltransferase
VIASLSRGVQTLREGMPLVIFPEGGRARNGVTGPFMAGAAWMAIKAQTPLVPITLVGTYELLPMHARVLRPTPLTLVIGEPIQTEGLTIGQANELTERLRQIIVDTYGQHGSPWI